MDFNVDEVIAVSGFSSLFKMAINKPNGLVLEDMDTGKRRFYSTRKNQFTPLGSIAIYTEDDSRPIKDVFKMMHDAAEDFTAPQHKSKPEEIIEYFTEVMPDYDTDQVSPGDIRKVLKWYNFLMKHDFFNREIPVVPSEEEE